MVYIERVINVNVYQVILREIKKRIVFPVIINVAHVIMSKLAFLVIKLEIILTIVNVIRVIMR
jgi:hypothetical protein